MKRLTTCLVMALLAVGAVFIGSQFADAAITGSAYDFQSAGWNNTGEICAPCHTPHNADPNVKPLWNHEVTEATFTTYSSDTLDAADVVQPTGPSKLCLSCHDGTVALDNFGGTTGGTNFISGAADLGTDLSTSHPISFTYDTALATADGFLYDPANTSSGIGRNIDEDMLAGPGNDQMECSSCHDVHNERSISYLLKKDNAGSALCMTCHDK